MIVNGKRALAYIVRVDEVKPLEGYDRVEYARTNGWCCVVEKDEVNPEYQYKTKIYTKTDARQNNVQLACKELNGTIVAPGEIFSFCDSWSKG